MSGKEHKRMGLKKHGITSETIKNMILGAGVIYKNLKYTVQLGMLIGAAAGMAFCNLIIYILHLFLSFKFGLGLSLFWGVFETPVVPVAK